MVTTRCSGSSYLNRVELQDGCLSLGHANTFIPSTIAGSNFCNSTGGVDEGKLKENLNLAMTAYISRVNGCPCGDTFIQLFRGSDLSQFQKINASLEIFLKGSMKQKHDLHNKEPELYTCFEKVWNIRNKHMVKNLPPYIFFLKCCYKDDHLHHQERIKI